MSDPFLPYGRQQIDEDDIQAVVEVLRSDWLTTGPKVDELELAFAQLVGAREAVAVSSGTAALHAAMYALDIGPGDEVIVPSMTFAATANCVIYQGGTPVFCDVEPGTLLLDPGLSDRLITTRTKAILAVDYAGQPCDYDALRAIAERRGLALVADACHALGGAYKGRSVGALADLSVFSLHAVKHITSGEGGVVTTDDPGLARRMRVFRNHGIAADARERRRNRTWAYDMTDLGFNYRITDIQCALGLSQLRKLPGFVKRRREIAAAYDRALRGLEHFRPLEMRGDALHAYHLYVVRMRPTRGLSRAEAFASLRSQGIGANVHYVPVHLHRFYRERFGTASGLCPAAEAAYQEILSLPIFPGMSDGDAQDVIDALGRIDSGAPA